MVRDTPIEDAVSPRALPVLLPRAKLGGRGVPGRVDGGDVDLVARMLEVQERWRDAGDRVVLVRDVRERGAKLQGTCVASQHLRHRLEDGGHSQSGRQDLPKPCFRRAADRTLSW